MTGVINIYNAEGNRISILATSGCSILADFGEQFLDSYWDV
jgi:hypothetical protein